MYVEGTNKASEGTICEDLYGHAGILRSFFGGFQRLPKGSYAFPYWLWYVLLVGGFPSPQP